MAETDRNAIVAREYLEARGYVVLREKYYRAAQQRQRIAEVIRDLEIQQRQRTDRWAQRELCPEIRRLQDRCTFLYGAARAAGCSADELAGAEREAQK